MVDLVGADSAVGQRLGEHVQTLDLRSRPLGILHSLPEGATNTGAFFLAHMAAVRAAHGAPLRAFASQLVQEIADDPEALRKEIDKRMAAFRREVAVDEMDAAARDRVDTFALAYAAARLAKRYAVLPHSWRPLAAMHRCLRLAEKKLQPVQSIEAQLMDATLRDDVVRIGDDDVSVDEIEAADLFICERRGRRELWARRDTGLPKVFPNWARDQHRPEMKDYWVRADGGNFEMKRQIVPGGDKERVFVFTLPKA
jgi:hypothetical protein